MTSRVALWHEWNSVHSFKVRIVLAEKGVEWTDHTVQLLAFEHLLPAYLAINPEGVVPTLVHEERRLYDSTPICQYLDEVYESPPLMPADAFGRLEARRWLKFHDDVAHPALRDASFQLLYKPRLAAMPRAELEALVARLPRPERRRRFLDGAASAIDWPALAASIRACEGVAARVDAALAHGGPWLLGPDFTLADVAMAPFAERVVNLGVERVWAGRNAGARWAGRLLGRPAIDGSRPPLRYRLPRPDDAVLAELDRRLTEPGRPTSAPDGRPATNSPPGPSLY